MSDEQYLTVAEAAERIKTSDEMVRRMLREGRLAGKRLGGRRAGWRVAASEVERLLSPAMARPVSGPVPRRFRAAPSPLDVSLERVHALAEAQWAQKRGEVAEAARWERIAAGIAMSAEAER